MSDDLPMGWELVGFPEVVFFQEGPGLRKYQYRESGIPFLNIRTFVDERIDKKLCNYLDAEEVEQKYKHFLVDANDILVATSGSIGKMAIAKSQDLPLMLNTSIMRFRPITEERLERGFLYFFLKSNHFFAQAESAWTGTAQKNMGPSHVKTFSILLPPLNEQRRIVDKLDRIGDRQRSARNELNHIPKLIARYKQAVLAAACSGKLTEDWRVKQNLDDSWHTTTLGEIIIDKPKNGYSAKPVQFETPFRVLTLTATTSGKFNPEHFKYFEEPIEEKSQFWLQPNDILIQRGNTIEYVGVPAIYDGLPNQFIFPDLMIRLRAKENVTTQFLYFVLSSENSRQYLRDRATGTAGSMPKINQPTLISLPIELPPLEEQKEIVRRVEKMFEKIDRMEEEYQQAAKLCDRLEQATLAKAFRGELVPQDPDDEPASVLLEQVKRERSKGKIKIKK